MNRNPQGQVVVRKRISATREELFDAWIDPVGMREWMCPGDIQTTEVQIDPRVGGSLVIFMRGPKETFEHRGEFTVVDRPSKLAFTWMAKATGWRPTLVTIEFAEVTPNETEVVLTHQDFPDDEVLAQYRGGWNQITDRLRQYLQKGDHENG
jgi:uncharacterized protein YndB with AHSA1/START domain